MIIPSPTGTDLTLLIDLDIYSDSPAWLLQLLSQYGLTEVGEFEYCLNVCRVRNLFVKL
jgi:hypothetical protein